MSCPVIKYYVSVVLLRGKLASDFVPIGSVQHGSERLNCHGDLHVASAACESLSCLATADLATINRAYVVTEPLGPPRRYMRCMQRHRMRALRSLYNKHKICMHASRPPARTAACGGLLHRGEAGPMRSLLCKV